MNPTETGPAAPSGFVETPQQPSDVHLITKIVGARKVARSNDGKLLETFRGACVPLAEPAGANRTQSRATTTLRAMLLPRLRIGELSEAEIRN